ncbi:uncharacterized protein V1510DRAFT_412363 [Dipodascopsis tothii]|uniref:uncharacterized protein n=1 Tax=Dipodascopsis tothii TaxID=44089 RepID=UPI0034CFB148
MADDEAAKAEKLAAARKRFEQLKKQKKKGGAKKQGAKDDEADEAAPATADDDGDEAEAAGADAADEAAADAADERTAALEQRVKELESALAAAEASAATKADDTNAAAAVAPPADDLTAVVESLRAEVRSLQTTNEELEAKMADHTTSAKEAINRADAAERMRTELEQQLADSKAQIETLAREKSMLKAQLARRNSTSHVISPSPSQDGDGSVGVHRTRSSSSARSPISPEAAFDGADRAEQQLRAKDQTIESMRLEINKLTRELESAGSGGRAIEGAAAKLSSFFGSRAPASPPSPSRLGTVDEYKYRELEEKFSREAKGRYEIEKKYQELDRRFLKVEGSNSILTADLAKLKEQYSAAEKKHAGLVQQLNERLHEDGQKAAQLGVENRNLLNTINTLKARAQELESLNGQMVAQIERYEEVTRRKIEAGTGDAVAGEDGRIDKEDFELLSLIDKDKLENKIRQLEDSVADYARRLEDAESRAAAAAALQQQQSVAPLGSYPMSASSSGSPAADSPYTHGHRPSISERLSTSGAGSLMNAFSRRQLTSAAAAALTSFTGGIANTVSPPPVSRESEYAEVDLDESTEHGGGWVAASAEEVAAEEASMMKAHLLVSQRAIKAEMDRWKGFQLDLTPIDEHMPAGMAGAGEVFTI